MFYHRPKKITVNSLLNDYKNYRALSRISNIIDNFLKSHDELKDRRLFKNVSILNVIRRVPNQLFIQHTNFKQGFFINSHDLEKHIFYLGTTGSGMSQYLMPQSLLLHSSIMRNKIDSDTIINRIENYKHNKYETLSVIMNNDYEVIAQYKGKRIILYLYIPHVDYFVQLNYRDKKLVKFYSSFNQSIDIIQNNITFLLMLDDINGDYQNILEQDISATDKMTLSAMFNI